MRALLRDPSVRAADDAFVLEGPRVVEGALARGAHIDALYVGAGAEADSVALTERARTGGARIVTIADDAVERVGSTLSPQPVFAVAARPARSLAEIQGVAPVVVTVDVADPGNLGTIVRSAEAAGASGVVVCGSSVDVYNPKVVRSSVGAIFGLAVVEARDAGEVLDEMAAQGRRRIGTSARGGRRHVEADLATPCALVLGNEARGLDPVLDDRLDETVTIPMSDPAESLNVAMAATVLLFESARQRQHAGITRRDAR